MRRVGVVVGIGFFVACGGSSSDPGGDTGNDGGVDGGGGPPVIQGCPMTPPAENDSGINAKCGVFVSSSKGTSDGDGSDLAPFSSLQKAIDSAKVSGKRIYVCAQSYREQITLADNVELYGYFDCTASTWKVGTGKAVIEGPASPTVKATGINHARIDGFEIRSPDATKPSESSVVLYVTSSPGLTILGSKILSGRGGRGSDGKNGVQLALIGGGGMPGIGEEDCCINYACDQYRQDCDRAHREPVVGIDGRCEGAPGYTTYRGGSGGIGGRYSAFSGAWDDRGSRPGAGAAQAGNPFIAPGGGVDGSPPATPGRVGDPGIDGANGSSFGKFTDDGTYVPSNGSVGTDGKSGQGGGGGGGRTPAAPPGDRRNLWTSTGGGGGAGGCPGTVGQPGTGGGASIAVVSIQSSIQFTRSVVETSSGGEGGRGTQGSAPTPGAQPGGNGAPGGIGGRAGVSGSGGGGPSIAIAFRGNAPVLMDTQMSPGPGGAGAPELKAEGRGTIPASPNGISAATREF